MFGLGFLTLIAVFFISQSMFAAELAGSIKLSQLPKGLSCRAENKAAHGYSPGKPILFTGIDTEANDDDRDNIDGRIDSVSIEPVTQIVLHNGCDNYYEFIFVTTDLVKLAGGDLPKVRGLLYFGNPMGDEGDGMVEDTTPVVCEAFSGPIK